MSKKWALMALALVVAVAVLFSGCIDIEWPSRYKCLYLDVATDGSAGVFVGWRDEGTVYTQRVDSQGNLRWGQGLVLNTAPSWNGPYIVRDNLDGIIALWNEQSKDINGHRGGNYAQRINSEGKFLWGQGGKPVPGLGCMCDVVTDGSGGTIIASDGPELKMQRIDHEGKVMWSEEGITICTTLTSGSGNEPRVLADGSGGAIIVWPDNRAAYGRYDIYAQRISPEGEILWQEGGIPVCAPQHGQTTPQIVSDGSDGAIVAWLGGGVRVQRLSPSGEVLWQEDGVQVNVLPSQGTYPLGMISDGAGGAIVVWHPSLSPALEGSLRGLRAQRVNSEGEVQWAEPAKLFVGLNVCAWEGVYSSMTADITGDGSGGAIIVGIFCVRGPSPNAQRVNLDGEPLWREGGVELFGGPQADFSLFQGPVVSDGSGGAIFVTETGKKETYLDRIYARRIDSQGKLLWTDEGVQVWPT
jgi:hypothetical protein